MLKNGLIAGFACLAGIAAYVFLVRDSAEKADPGPEQQVIDTTGARIAAESGEVFPEPVVRAIPQPSQVEAVADRSEIQAPPSPPDGYSFVAFDGEMPTAPIDDPVIPGRPRVENREWLGSAGAIQALVDQSVAAGRPWSFG